MIYLRWVKINYFLEIVIRVNKDIYIFNCYFLIKKYSRENIYIKLRVR